MTDDTPMSQGGAEDSERQDQPRDESIGREQDRQNAGDADRDPPADETSGAGYGNHAGDEDGAEMNQEPSPDR